jgi:hypothetical protein
VISDTHSDLLSSYELPSGLGLSPPTNGSSTGAGGVNNSTAKPIAKQSLGKKSPPGFPDNPDSFVL